MILIIDDNPSIRYTLTEICTFADWRSITAASGKAGLELFQKADPEIVLIDYHMSDGDGLTVTKKIREQNKQVPIIVLTVDERQEIADQFLQAGATDFALKPIKAPDLIARIKLHFRISKLTMEQDKVYVEKGINPATLADIKHLLLQHDKPLSIQEVQKQLPIAYQTVHRYLHHLADKGEVTIETHYGAKGRPKNRYLIV